MRSGRRPPVAKRADGQELLDRQLAPEPLVGERGVEVPVGEHDGASLQRRADHRLDQLGAGGHEEQRVGPLGEQ